MRWNPIYKYIAIIIFSLAVAGASIYFHLGGFREIHVVEMMGEPKVVIGQSFVGKENHPDIIRYFREAQALILDSAVMGTLVRVIDRNESVESNKVEYFIGVLIESDMAEVPSGYEAREYFPKQRLAVFLDMNKWVRPSSKRIDMMLKNKANSSGYDLPSKIVEIYYIDDSMSVEGWIN